MAADPPDPSTFEALAPPARLDKRALALVGFGRDRLDAAAEAVDEAATKGADEAAAELEALTAAVVAAADAVHQTALAPLEALAADVGSRAKTWATDAIDALSAGRGAADDMVTGVADAVAALAEKVEADGAGRQTPALGTLDADMSGAVAAVVAAEWNSGAIAGLTRRLASHFSDLRSQFEAEFDRRFSSAAGADEAKTSLTDAVEAAAASPTAALAAATEAHAGRVRERAEAAAAARTAVVDAIVVAWREVEVELAALADEIRGAARTATSAVGDAVARASNEIATGLRGTLDAVAAGVTVGATSLAATAKVFAMSADLRFSAALIGAKTAFSADIDAVSRTARDGLASVEHAFADRAKDAVERAAATVARARADRQGKLDERVGSARVELDAEAGKQARAIGIEGDSAKAKADKAYAAAGHTEDGASVTEVRTMSAQTRDAVQKDVEAGADALLEAVANALDDALDALESEISAWASAADAAADAAVAAVSAQADAVVADASARREAAVAALEMLATERAESARTALSAALTAGAETISSAVGEAASAAESSAARCRDALAAASSAAETALTEWLGSWFETLSAEVDDFRAEAMAAAGALDEAVEAAQEAALERHADGADDANSGLDELADAATAEIRAAWTAADDAVALRLSDHAAAARAATRGALTAVAEGSSTAYAKALDDASMALTGAADTLDVIRARLDAAMNRNDAAEALPIIESDALGPARAVVAGFDASARSAHGDALADADGQLAAISAALAESALADSARESAAIRADVVARIRAVCQGLDEQVIVPHRQRIADADTARRALEATIAARLDVVDAALDLGDDGESALRAFADDVAPAIVTAVQQGLESVLEGYGDALRDAGFSLDAPMQALGHAMATPPVPQTAVDVLRDGVVVAIGAAAAEWVHQIETWSASWGDDADALIAELDSLETRLVESVGGAADRVGELTSSLRAALPTEARLEAVARISKMCKAQLTSIDAGATSRAVSGLSVELGRIIEANSSTGDDLVAALGAVKAELAALSAAAATGGDDAAKTAEDAVAEVVTQADDLGQPLLDADEAITAAFEAKTLAPITAAGETSVAAVQKAAALVPDA